jgi:hypothetical protein
MLVLIDLQTEFFRAAKAVLSAVAYEMGNHQSIVLVSFYGMGRQLITRDWLYGEQEIIRISKNQVSGAAEIIREIGKDWTLTVGGVYTSQCVCDTVCDLVKEGVTVDLLPNCCSDRDPESHKKGLVAMKAAGARLR